MNKINTTFFVIFTAFTVASCSKDNSVKPAKTQAIIFADKSELGQGD